MTNIDVIADPNSPAAAWGRVTARRLARTAATAERKRLQVGVSRAVIEALSEEPDGEGKIHRFLWLVLELAELAAPPPSGRFAPGAGRSPRGSAAVDGREPVRVEVDGVSQRESPAA